MQTHGTICEETTIGPQVENFALDGDSLSLSLGEEAFGDYKSSLRKLLSFMSVLVCSYTLLPTRFGQSYAKTGDEQDRPSVIPPSP